jgi:hypothetical protein
MALTELVLETYGLISGLIESTDLLYSGLINNNLKVIGEAEGIMKHIGGRTDPLTEEITSESKADANALPYVPVPSHIRLMGDNLGRIASGLGRKAEEEVLFSDRALSELGYLFERTRDIILHTRDMVLAPNTLVARHLEESDLAVVRNANDYATRHEERLIEGICTPKASSIYLEMLDAFKEIASHARKIGKDLAG